MNNSCDDQCQTLLNTKLKRLILSDDLSPQKHLRREYLKRVDTLKWLLLAFFTQDLRFFHESINYMINYTSIYYRRENSVDVTKVPVITFRMTGKVGSPDFTGQTYSSHNDEVVK